MNEFDRLIGKTIASAVKMKPSGLDDEGFLKLEFSDGSEVFIVASYCGYTGNSIDEYGTDIFATDKAQLDDAYGPLDLQPVNFEVEGSK